MKKLMTAIFCFASFGYAFGQIEWVGNHGFSEAATDIVRTSQNQYILVHGEGNGITVFDSLGDLVFSKRYYGQIFDIVEMPDSSIVFSASMDGCDLPADSIFKFNKDWGIVWSAPSLPAGPACRLTDNSFVTGGKFGHIERRAASGSLIFSTQLTGYQMLDLVATQDDTLLFATNQGLLKVDKNGMPGQVYPSLIFDKLELTDAAQLLAQHGDTLFLLSESLQHLGSYIGQDSIVDFAFHGNQIALLTSKPQIIRLDLSLQPLDTIALIGHNQVFRTLSFANNGFWVGGSERYGSTEHGNNSAFIKEYALDGTTANTASDIALTLVSQNGVIEVKNYFGIYSIQIHDIAITVENFGTTTVESLRLNFMRPEQPGFPCPINQSFSKDFDNLSLQGGTTTVLTWDVLKLASWNDDLAGEQIELCFWTSLPNHQLETNNSNDVNCTEVLVAQQERLAGELKVAYDPANDIVIFELPSTLIGKPISLAVFDVLGQMKDYRHSISGQEYDMTNFPDGCYVLKLTQAGRSYTAKLIKY